MSSININEVLSNLTKPTTDAINSTVSSLLYHICDVATTTTSTHRPNNTNSGDDASMFVQQNNSNIISSNDIVVEATCVSEPLAQSLLSRANPNKNSNNTIPGDPKIAQSAHALICVIDRIFSYKGTDVKNEVLRVGVIGGGTLSTSNNNNNSNNSQQRQTKDFDVQLVNAAWNVLKKELQIKMPVVIARVLSSFPPKQGAQMQLIVRKWLNGGIMINSEGKTILTNALEQSSQKTTSTIDVDAGVKNAAALNEDAAAATSSSSNQEGGSDDALSRQQQKIKLTSAEANRRIELLKHLCEGLESIPQGNADALTLRNHLLEFGLETAIKNGGTKRWGTLNNISNDSSNVAIGGELRALMAVLQGQSGLNLLASSTTAVQGEEEAETDASQQNQEQTEQKQLPSSSEDAATTSLITKSSSSSKEQQIVKNELVTKKLLDEACDAVDDILNQLERQRREVQQLKDNQLQQQSHQHHQQQQQQQVNQRELLLTLSPAASAVTGRKIQPLSVPVYTSLVLDRPTTTVMSDAEMNASNTNSSSTSSSSSFVSATTEATNALLSRMLQRADQQQPGSFSSSSSSVLNNNNNNINTNKSTIARGPLPPPDSQSPYYVPPLLSERGRLAHRCWAPRSDEWAVKGNSVRSLKWVVVEGLNDEDGETTVAKEEEESGKVRRVTAASQTFFF